jgi:hypothetical protein
MSNSLPIPSRLFALQQDPALQQDANYQLDDQDRAAIDSQNQAVQTHLLQSVLLGATATWVTVDSGSAACPVGTAVCLAGSVLNTVTLATAGALATAGSVFGVVVQGGIAGQSIRVVTRGSVPQSVTGLVGSAGIYCFVTGSGVLAQEHSFTAGQFIVGTVDGAGNLNVFAQIPPAGTGGSGGTQFNAYVAVVGPASIAAALNTYYLVDVSGGAVSIITPASGLAAGTLFGTKIVKGPVSATDKLTVTAAASATIEEPLEQSAPLTGVYGANAIFQLPGDLGSSVIWFYDGVSKWGQQ